MKIGAMAVFFPAIPPFKAAPYGRGVQEFQECFGVLNIRSRVFEAKNLWAMMTIHCLAFADPADAECLLLTLRHWIQTQRVIHCFSEIALH